MSNQNLLTVTDLSIAFRGAGDACTQVLQQVSFSIRQGEIFALLGESGSGKSVTALSIMQLLPPNAVYLPGSHVDFHGDLLQISERSMQEIRGKSIAMIFQEPMTSLNPVMTIGAQLAENCRNPATPERLEALLTRVGVSDPKRRLQQYPHQLSGGMKQRVVIAMALAGEPELLIADEPTTALDVTIQAQILQLLKSIQSETQMAILLITHDLAVVNQMADHLAVMYAGEIVEQGETQAILSHPQHPYTLQLLQAVPGLHNKNEALQVPKNHSHSVTSSKQGCQFVPRCPDVHARCETETPLLRPQGDSMLRCHLTTSPTNITPSSTSIPSSIVEHQATRSALSVTGLSVHYGALKAVDNIDIQLSHGKTLALVGESGCGKSSVALGLMDLVPITGGVVKIDEQPLQDYTRHRLRETAQIVFQDPYSSMDARFTIGDILLEGVQALKTLSQTEQAALCDKLLESVDLSPQIKNRYPHEFSGGQRQRICIARALSVSPSLLILDEPTSALDVSIQAQVLNLLRSLQQTHQLSYLFISHNLAVVAHIADEVAVMYLGRIVELAPAQSLFSTPKHPYTQALIAAIPSLTIKKLPTPIQGELPSPLSPPTGCHFHPRCPFVMPKCRETYPPAFETGDAKVHCYLYE